MKFKMLFYAWPILALLTTACQDDNAVAPKAAVTLQTTLASGDWEVASYEDAHPTPPLVEDAGTHQDKEDLNDLHNYSFSFLPKDMIVITAYGSTDPIGLWVATTEESSGTETLDMQYAYKPLDGLNGKWTVTERTDTRIGLKLHDEVWGGDDRIVFRRITDDNPKSTSSGNN